MTQRALNDVVKVTGLSSGAKILYTYFFGLRSGDIVSNEKLINENIAVSRAMVNIYKRELKSKGLLHENKDGETNIRFMYLGSLHTAAVVYAMDWNRVESDEE